MQPYLRAKCAGDDILADIGKVAAAHARGRREKLRIDVIHKGTAAMKNANGALQLGYGDAVERQPAIRVCVVVERAVRAGQIEGEPSLISKDCSQSPAANNPVENSWPIEKGFATTEGKVVGPTGMDDMPQVKCRRAVR